jgi:hypothetical protein
MIDPPDIELTAWASFLESQRTSSPAAIASSISDW